MADVWSIVKRLQEERRLKLKAAPNEYVAVPNAGIHSFGFLELSYAVESPSELQAGVIAELIGDGPEVIPSGRTTCFTTSHEQVAADVAFLLNQARKARTSEVGHVG